MTLSDESKSCPNAQQAFLTENCVVFCDVWRLSLVQSPNSQEQVCFG